MACESVRDAVVLEKPRRLAVVGKTGSPFRFGVEIESAVLVRRGCKLINGLLKIGELKKLLLLSK